VSGPPVLPVFDDESAPFWEGTRQGELRIQQCAETGRLIFPPRATSPFAPHVEPGWTAVSGRGRIWSFVVPHAPLMAQFTELAPYNVILVELDEDPRVRLVGNLVKRPDGDINELDPATIRIGARVRVVFERVDERITLPRWTLLEQA